MEPDDIERFFAEQQERMAISDDDFAEYETRMSREKQRYVAECILPVPPRLDRLDALFRRKRERMDQEDKDLTHRSDLAPKKERPNESQYANTHVIPAGVSVSEDSGRPNGRPNGCVERFSSEGTTQPTYTCKQDR